MAGRRQSEDAKDAAQREVPAWLLVVLLAASAVLAAMFWLGISEDRALSATTTGRLLAGGEPGTAYEGESYCKGSRVEFEVDGLTYGGVEPVRGVGCPTGDDTVEVAVRYDPDTPATFSASGAQPVLWGLLAASVLGFAAVLAAVLRRTWSRLFSWRGELRSDS